MWGQHISADRTTSSGRFTPTRVGTTTTRDFNADIIAVHPHACGDNSGSSLGFLPLYGSPPRVWGQLMFDNKMFQAGRFTPTRVGTTTTLQGTAMVITVHPHACGDNSSLGASLNLEAGSPPRVWGQPTKKNPKRFVCRFTPTRVGTTPGETEKWKIQSVHPHACGDNDEEGRLHHVGYGSPPRVWGQLRLPRLRRLGGTVHPHACGDNHLHGYYRVDVSGSPPRVWGQLIDNEHDGTNYRFTPTRVGTT